MAFSFRVGTNWCHDFPKLARESGFYFNMHRSRVRVDWNRISNIDIDRVIRERDFYVVDENVNNVVDYCLESEYDVKILDPNFVKLFRLAQLAVEYLLYCKQYLDHSIVILKEELRSKIEENVKLKKEVAVLEEVVKHLKEKSREKGRLIETKIGDCNGEIHKCPHCPKTFVSAMFVNAHVARRHAYLSDLCLSSSPLHDQYRVETEKLHNEIKSLKERLNQTERIIRTESNRVSGRTKPDYERRLSENEVEHYKHDNNKSGDHNEQKGYQEEINNLKTMLFDEIRNLKQREKTIYERASETNVQSLINQQEKEFQKLRNQLLERLTPDIESVYAKLHAQEDYWKSKIEHLENQHHQDVEKLSTELKATQNAADRVKAQYECKVSDLERQTMNQSNILLEQSKQLHSLSREMNSSQTDRFQDREIALPEKSSQPATLQLHSYRNLKPSNENDSGPKNRVVAKSEQIVVEDLDSVSSLEPADNARSLIAENKLFSTKSRASQLEIKKVAPKIKESTKQRTSKSSKATNKLFENARNAKKSMQSYESPDASQSQESTEEKQIERTKRASKRDFDSGILPRKNVAETFSSPAKNSKQAEVLEDERTSETISESPTLDSLTTSESESVDTIRNTPAHGNKPSSLFVPASAKVTSKSAVHKNSEIDLQDEFDKKLRDLGIDPEWQGIPKATFKQKMDIIKHHQNIATKKFPKYNQIKMKIVEKLLNKISRGSKEIENAKPVKKTLLSKIVANVKSKPMKAFGDQKSPDIRTPVSKLQDVTPGRFYSKSELNYSPKNVIKATEYKSAESEIKFSPSLAKSQENMRNVTSSHEISTKSISYDSFSKIRPLFDAVHDNEALNGRDKSSKSFEGDILNSSNLQQELKNVSASPKSNKSVLKSTAGSTGSLIKKKVIFDLTNDKDAVSLSEYDLGKDELNDGNRNTSSHLNVEEYEPEKYNSTGNILLKTAQSEKIAEISRKLDAQLSMVRQKPVGSVETMFSSNAIQRKNNNIENHQSGEKSRSESNFTTTNDFFPKPTPRNLKDRIPDAAITNSTLEGSDFDSDIDQILQLD